MAELNLCELLKGHEGEVFYFNRIDEHVILKEVKEKHIIVTTGHQTHVLSSKGSWYPDGDTALFPSKYCRDWTKWAGNRPDKEAKVWSDLEYCNVEVFAAIKQLESNGPVEPICKSALALLKINELIEAGYGGNVTNEEWAKSDGNNLIYVPFYNPIEEEFQYFGIFGLHRKSLIAFHTLRQINGFLKYPENIQLLKDYYMMSRL